MPNLVNLLKCKIMHVGTSFTSSAYTLYDTSAGECVLLAEADCEKDLYIWISSDLKPSIHCCKATASAIKVLYMIRRSYVNISKEMFSFLYKTYVRPHLDYCSSIWSPYIVKDVDILEKVHTRLIKGFD